uniref:Uncharacterized protein n=1 Tax=Brassica oleracea TaxID=3712 RepID=A0A3P6AYT0_BRAOL|nr:unnamed protein product [Brassica oleracea]
MSSSEAFPVMQEIMLEFRAGKMSLQGTRVVPDARKGLVRIARGEEGLVHFQWLDRTLNAVEDDQIVFPDEAIFEKVNQSSDRVYILKFNSDDRKLFLWLQEPRAEGDADICSAVNQYLNQPLGTFCSPEFGEGDAVAIPEEVEEIAEDDVSSRAGNLVVPNVSTEVSDVSSSSGPVKLADLQRILNNLSSGPAGITEDEDEGLVLGDILKPELIMPLLEMLPVQERLSSHLPEGHCRAEDILELLQSPPFRQQVDAFTYVLRTGQIDLTQFGIDPSKYKFTVISFLEALEDSVSSQSNDAMDENLKFGRCLSTVQARLLRFCLARNVKKLWGDEAWICSLLDSKLKLTEFNFTSKHQSFTISHIFEKHQRPPLPSFAEQRSNNQPGEDMPRAGAVSSKRSGEITGEASKNTGASDCLGIVEGGDADPPIQSDEAVFVDSTTTNEPPTDDVREGKKPRRA